MSDIEKNSQESSAENEETEIGRTSLSNTPYPANIWQPPKRSKFKAIAWTVLAVLTLLFGIFLSIGLLKTEEPKTPESDIYYGHIMGTITDTQVFAYAMEGNTVIVRYTFTIGHKTFNGNYTYQNPWSNLNIGSQLEIAYNPTNPSHNKPADEIDDSSPAWGLVITLLIPILILLLFFGFKAWAEWWFLGL